MENYPSIKDSKFSNEVAITMIVDFSLASPLIESIVRAYSDEPESMTFTTNLIHQIWTILQSGEKLTLDQFIINAYSTPELLKFWGDYASLLSLKPSEFPKNNTFSEIRDELKVKELIEEAY